MRILLALLLAAHAIAHLPGFLLSWNLMTVPESHFKTTVLGSRVDVGVPGIRVFGVIWLLTGLLMALAAVGVFRNTDGAYALAWSAVVASTVMTILGWPDSKVGLVVNGVILVALIIPQFVR